MRQTKLTLVMLLSLAAIAEASAQTQPAPPIRTDRYGDPLPAGALTRLGTVRFRMDGLVYACTYSPDGKTLAASADDIVYLFDGATGKPLRRLRGNGPGDLLSLAYSPDGKTLAASSADNTILSWEPNTGKLLRSFGTPLKGFPVRSLAFTPDGRGLVSGGEASVIYLWDPATGMKLRRFTEFKIEVHCLALSKDGRTIASADLHEIRLWETASGKRVRLLKGTEGRIRALAFSPDGKLLASGNDDHTVWLWETATGKVRHKLPGKRQKGVPGEFGDVCALAFSPGGKTLATGSTNHTLRLWDVAEGKLLREVPGIRSVSRDGYHEGGIPCVAFSPDGRKLAFGQDKRLALLDVQSGAEVPRLAAHGGAVRRVFFSRDCQRLITISDDAVRRILEWDASSGRLIRDVPGKPWWARQATLSSDRKILAATGFGFGLQLTDTESGRKLREIPVPNAPSGGIPHAVAFSPDGQLLAMSGINGEAVWLINAATGKTICVVEGAGRRPFQAVLLTFSPDGRLLASAGWDTIHLADVPSGRQRFKITLPNDHSVTAFAFSPDGRSLAAARFDTSLDEPIGTITEWEIASGEERLRFRAPPGRLSALVFSPDGRWLAAGGEERSVYLWDSATGKQVCRLEGHRGTVESLEFAPDGRRLASASADTTALIWDVPVSPKAQASSTALTREELRSLWSALASNDASKAYQAMHKLESVPVQAVPLLAERLRPKAAADARHVTRLLSQLDSETFAERECATEELRELGWSVESSLREALEGKLSLEMRKRINDLLAGIRGVRLPTDLLRMLRGVEVLERINSEASRQLLRKLADPSLPEGLGRDELRREADAALRRLAKS